MVYRPIHWTLIALAALMAPVAPAQSQNGPPEGDHIVVCRIDEMIDEGIAVIVERAVAEAANAKAIIFEIDTLGGRVDSALRIAEAIGRAPCPTIAWVTGDGAISAGALISYACNRIIMAPGKSIGASTPFSPGAEAADQVTEKSMSFLRTQYRALGEQNGHDPLLGEAMVDNEIELWGTENEDGSWTIYKIESDRVVATSISSAEEHRTLMSLSGLFMQVPGGLEPLERAIRDVLEDPALERERREREEAKEEQVNIGMPSELPEDAVLISRAGKLLTMTSGEAERFGLIPTTARNIDEVRGYYGLTDYAVYRVEPTWAEHFFRWLTSPLISGLLLMLGLGGLYLEIRTPGFGLPGLIGLSCMALFFGSYLVIGIADWVDVLLVVIGISLIFIELFLLPGFGVAGIAGIVCLLVGTYLSLTRVPIPQYDWEFQRLTDAGQTVAIATFLFTAFAALSWRYLPSSPIFKLLVLDSAQPLDEGYVVSSTADASTAVGLRGETLSPLRPAGRGRFGQKTYDIVSRGEFIEAHVPIEIIRVTGNQYVVKALPEDNHT